MHLKYVHVYLFYIFLVPRSFDSTDYWKEKASKVWNTFVLPPNIKEKTANWELGRNNKVVKFMMKIFKLFDWICYLSILKISLLLIKMSFGFQKFCTRAVFKCLPCNVFFKYILPSFAWSMTLKMLFCYIPSYCILIMY